MSCASLQGMALGLILLSLSACAPPSVDPAPQAVKAATAPPGRVDLPPMIKLAGSLPPEINPDSTLRVGGLLARRGKYMKQKVIVKGYVVDTYTCPKKAKRCQPPHVWLADTPAGEGKRLMLVNLEEKRVKKLKQGSQQVITGVFADRSDDGFVRSAGLLIHEAMESTEERDRKNAKKKK
jgi:hypothetical protein